MKYSTQNSAQQGFTLIELAVVLFILSLLLSSFLAPLAARVEQRERNSTQTQLDEIEAAIYGFVLRNNHFPCPDCREAIGDCATATINDGQEDRTTANACAVAVTDDGNLPWADLGVKGTDDWENNFTYRVTGQFADTTDGTGCATFPTQDVSFSLCSDGNITVNNDSGARIATDIPAIVVSHGKNWADTPSADEDENIDGDGDFVDRDYSQSEFDDMLIWISPHALRTVAVKSGILP